MKKIQLFIFCFISLQAACQSNSSANTLDFGSDSMGIKKDYNNKDSIVERNNGLKFFGFLHRQNLKTYMRCGQCFFLYNEETKTSYCVCESESCRTHINIPVSVKKNNKEIGFQGLYEVANLIIENKEHLKETISKNHLEKGEVSYLVLKRSITRKK